MINKLSTIIFLVGLLILLAVNIIMIHSKEDYNQQKKVTMTIWVIFSIILISGAWILREYKHEKYDYNYAIQNGKLVGGTVYASYPEQVGGLGWVL